MKKLEMNELKAKIKSLAERNRLATTDEERAAVAAEMGQAVMAFWDATTVAEMGRSGRMPVSMATSLMTGSRL